MYVRQVILPQVLKWLRPGKVVVVYGARRVGKTTLVGKAVEESGYKTLKLNGDDIDARELLGSQSLERLRTLVGGNELLVVDEAQRIPGIGQSLKLLVDEVSGLRVLATGSSSFDLAKETGEPLTGRKMTFHLHPLSQKELGGVESLNKTLSSLESRLIYGSYPEVVLSSDDEERRAYLRDIVDSYLLKDILQFDSVRKSDKIIRLLQLVALQIGGEVSVTELGTQLGLGKNTVDRYLDLLVKSFVLIRRGGFSRNLRKEITKNVRYYFVDNGIRNSLIANHNPMSLRGDTGQVWENYIVSERIKVLDYAGTGMNSYFWRTHDGQEIDVVEEEGGKLAGYEIKWGKCRTKPPRAWMSSYPDATFRIVNKDNYLEYIT